MTFKEYLQKRRITYDASGDFVFEALKDSKLAEARSWPELEALVSQYRGFSDVEAAKSIWQAYKAEAHRLEARNADKPYCR